jgi:hypothetical protein
VPGWFDGSGRRDRLRNVERALGRLEFDRDGLVVWQNDALDD